MQSRFDNALKDLPGLSAAPEVPFRILAAVSGGVDSMCLLDLLVHSSLPLEIVVAHCNFHLRAGESDADMELVRAESERYGVRFECKEFETEAYAREQGISVEMAARDLRYRFFAETAMRLDCAAVAVAHHADDNAETLILNLLRGTGLKGMCGMKTVSVLPVPDSGPIPLVRPMLSFTREEILSYAHSKGIRYREDSTNRDSRFKRNRIRNNVFPEFRNINPSFVRTLNRDMAYASAAQAVADAFYQENRSKVWDGEYVNVSVLKTLPNWEYVLYRIMDEMGFDAESVSSAVSMVRLGRVSGSRRLVASDIEFLGSRDRFFVRKKPAIVEGDICVVVEGPGTYVLEGKRITIDLLKTSGTPAWEGDGVVAFDASKAAFPFVIRHWAPGDWFRPLGMKGRKKLQDWFSDRHYSPIQKEETLVVRVPSMEDGRVAAILGRTIDDSLKLTQSSGEAVVIRIDAI